MNQYRTIIKSRYFKWLMVAILPVLCSCGASKIQYVFLKKNAQFISDTSVSLHSPGLVLVCDIRQDHYLNKRIKNHLYFRLDNNSTGTVVIEKGCSAELQKNTGFLDSGTIEHKIDSAFAEKILLPGKALYFYYNDWSTGFQGNLQELKGKLRGEKMTVKIVYRSGADSRITLTDSLSLVPALKNQQ